MAMKQLGALVLAAALASHAHGQTPDRRTPLEKYQGQTHFALTMCKLAYITAGARAQANEGPGEAGDWRGCQRDQRAEVKRYLDGALKTVRRPAAQAALKGHYVAFVASLDGLTPGPDERKITYQARQAALQDKLNEAWARFEVEQ
jgi:hypothetical protein